MAARKPGRLFFANPGPTNIPDSVLRAMDRATIDFMAADFLEIYDQAVAGLKRLLLTNQEVFLYAATGHGAWEATLQNLFSPGDAILMPQVGYFSVAWGKIAQRFGLELIGPEHDWRHGVDIAALQATLAADSAHRIKAVCIVHNETSTGVALPLPEIRAALDATAHPALLLVDTISSFGSLEFRMDDWGIDAVVGGSQKGLMLPAGLAFTAVSEKALAAHRDARLPRFYFDWSLMMARRHRSFMGTVPTGPFYGMLEAIALIEAEGLEQVWRRHTRLAEATRRAVSVWSGNEGVSFYCADRARRSNSVTAVLMPEGHDAELVRKIAYDRFNVSLGGGLDPLGGKLFRIGHMGDLNEPMLLGTLGVVELALAAAHAPFARGGVQAAIDYLGHDDHSIR
ncbi:MAG TPA: aminotransferase class V-fold PLP-dependent enzyme [Acidiphilium sp.]|nr:MAG: serine--glyoxylate aminotransferase [Acidiphilium sp. 21-60-14]OYV90321.1 MAG: serine--glyoxylate aminotransferase [Acidiphilium sp. 37-60-79]OZB38030.1 MAG: serine--glyoxylate aminotransferase [Acidiphilium sp. 34-60-192]HQT88997.1 aminotransferase class V-fold PLP-dependent enzyme [Acidiphilium sp.]HQU24014.1 aminotransferase class V-fold PLP-dependent enzyme [Acidiphilium sp.]